MGTMDGAVEWEMVRSRGLAPANVNGWRPPPPPLPPYSAVFSASPDNTAPRKLAVRPVPPPPVRAGKTPSWFLDLLPLDRNDKDKERRR